MRVQASTSNHVGDEVDATLGRFVDRITRVEVHPDHVDGPEAVGDDKRCLVEARLVGRQPIAVSHRAPTLDEAIDGADEELERSLDRTLGRLNAPKGRTSRGVDQTT